MKIWQVSLGALFFSVFGVMFVDERGNGNRKCFSRIIVLQRRGCNFRSVSWCCGRVQSPNDVAQKIEKSLKNTHITIQRQLTIWCSAKPQNTQFLEFCTVPQVIPNRKWSRDSKWFPKWTANDPRPQVIPKVDRKWSRKKNRNGLDSS